MDKKYNQDHVAAVLAGIPIFCVGRNYINRDKDNIIHIARYMFQFDNGYGASVVEFVDKDFSSGHKYELAVIRGDDLVYDTDITNDVLRGDEKYIDDVLHDIEKLDRYV